MPDKRGIVIGVGVGPGDPELMTVKAVNTIKRVEIVAYPGQEACNCVAYRIAHKMVPEIGDKTLIAATMPMVDDKKIINDAAKKNVSEIERYLDEGKDVAFLTLGDPTVYSTFTYLQRLFESDGYKTEIVSGVTSFCAGAASLNIPVAEWDEELHIIPASHVADISLDYPGNYVYMKAGGKLEMIKRAIEDAKSEYGVYMVENCGMDSERGIKNISEIPDKSGYFTTVYCHTNEI